MASYTYASDIWKNDHSTVAYNSVEIVDSDWIVEDSGQTK